MGFWYDGTELQSHISNFKESDVRYITGLKYRIDYDQLYTQVSNMEIDFVVDNELGQYLLSVRFCMVSSLNIEGLGGCYNQLMGFRISDLSNFGYEAEKKYFVEDYENGLIQFYCKSIVILSIIQLRDKSISKIRLSLTKPSEGVI